MIRPWSERLMRQVYLGSEEVTQPVEFRRHPHVGDCKDICTCHYVYCGPERRGDRCSHCGCFLQMKPTPAELLAAVEFSCLR
jgi:hypothetical protein